MQAPPNKLLARPNDGPSEGWSVSDMRIMQHGNNCYLRFPLETGVITVYGNRKTMVSKLKDALEHGLLAGNSMFPACATLLI